MNQHARLKDITQEADLREHLVNLFERMSLEPDLTHGRREYGKDIVCRELNKTLGAVEWIGCVVKLGKITASASDKGSLQTVINQVQEAFIHPYVDTKTKQKVRMNKVFVITNDEILETARDKILEKISSLYGSGGANVHFFDGARLATLFDEHWPEFWDVPSRDLALDEPMAPEAGKVLYVVALAFNKHDRHAKKKSGQLSKSAIMKHTGLSESKVDGALNYLVQLQYLELQPNDSYTLHRKLTAGRLLKKANHIELFFLLDDKANSSRHLSAKDARRVAKKALGFTSRFVKEAMELFVRGDYLDVDTSRGKNHFKINDGMLQDEKTYLECWTKYKGKMPKGSSSTGR